MNSISRLRLDHNFMSNVAAWEKLPARDAHYAPFPHNLHFSLITALKQLGIESLYSHQALALTAALNGENVVVTTGTASGKTLCYNLPVLNTLLTSPHSRALYLFPTKALAQDQADELSQFSNSLIANYQLPITVRTYDGDTPQSQRSAIRKTASILISNPDMLHMGILPHHTKWADFLTNLRYVVLDELHVYRGVFGSHMANVLRRLKRLCAFYGASPQFICASATITNYQLHSEKLIEAPITAITADGSPRAEKHFIIYNPPLLDPALGLRRSYLLETQRLAGELMKDDVQTAIFARTRNATEILLGYTRDEARQQGRDPAGVRGYRGGYLPFERRDIERGLREGTVRTVVATNALELGVDIGQMGAVIMAGYPGTIASAWQQAGRAGRRATVEASLALLVASAAPLDQFLATHPRYLFETTPEHALINPDNLALLLSHLRCAVFELPFKSGESFGAFTEVEELLQVLVEDGDLHHSGNTYRWVADTYPADSVSLRSAGADQIVIQETRAGRPNIIGEVDRPTAPVRVHEGAVYLHEGRQYLVTRLDWDNAIAEVQPSDVDYFTEASEAVDIAVVNVHDAFSPLPAGDMSPEAKRSGEGPGVRASYAHGELLVTSLPASFRRVKRYTHETLGYGQIDLPAREFQTTGYWLWIPKPLVEQLAAEGILVAPNNYGPNWQQQRNAARARDGYHCQQCGKEEPSPISRSSEMGEGRVGVGGHDVHHLIPFRTFGYVPGLNDNYVQANDLSNLITLCRACHRRAEMSRGTQTALGGLAHALGNLAPLFLMCDPRDLGVLSESHSQETGAPTITLYDLIPEGLGFAGQLYDLHAELLRGAYDLIRACPCRDGCPACVGPVGLEITDTKTLARRLAERLVQ